MPLPPKNDHPLRRLRHVLGKHATQEWMAGVLGVGKTTVIRIENADRLVLTQAHKFTLASRFGIHPASFDEPGSPLVDVFQRPYSAESLELWEAAAGSIGKWECAQIGVATSLAVAALMQAASQAGTFLAVKLALDSWLQEAAERTGWTAFRAGLRDFSSRPIEQNTTIQALNDSTRLREIVAFPKTHSWKDEDQVTITGTVWIEPRLDFEKNAYASGAGKSGGQDRVSVKTHALTVCFEGQAKVGREVWSFSHKEPFERLQTAMMLRGVTPAMTIHEVGNPPKGPWGSGLLSAVSFDFLVAGDIDPLSRIVANAALSAREPADADSSIVPPAHAKEAIEVRRRRRRS